MTPPKKLFSPPLLEAEGKKIRFCTARRVRLEGERVEGERRIFRLILVYGLSIFIDFQTQKFLILNFEDIFLRRLK